MRIVGLFSLFHGAVQMGSCQNTVEEEPVPEPECTEYHSSSPDYAPIQMAESPLPAAALSKQWTLPVSYTNAVHFSGTAGHAANHEGIDYIHANESTTTVSVQAASSGTVVYVRTGCPQSDMFSPNQDVRECGSGWGNHIVIDHGDDVMTRYAHLTPNSIQVSVGDMVSTGDEIADMGNSGRSELRHLHFEMGTINEELDPCSGSQSFDYVYDPAEISALHP